MSDEIEHTDDLRNVKHQYDVDAMHPRLEISWEDSEGPHSLTLEHAEALSAGVCLYAKRGDEARREYLKEIIRETRV